MDVTVLLGKAMKKGANGVHQTAMEYPLNRWVQDPNGIKGSHDHCVHMATPWEVLNGDFNSFAGADEEPHQLVMLPSVDMWAQSNGAGRCHHDLQVYPLVCRTCTGLELDELEDSDVQRDLLTAPGYRSFPTGPSFAESPIDPRLFRRSILIEPN